MRSSLILTVAAVSVLGRRGIGRKASADSIRSSMSSRRGSPYSACTARQPSRRPRRSPAGRGSVRQKSPRSWLWEAIGNTTADYLFDGSMEGDFDRAFPAVRRVREGHRRGGGPSTDRRAALPPSADREDARDRARPGEGRSSDIGKQLNLGVSGVVFVGVESRRRSEDRARRDALQVQGRHALGRRRQRAGVLGHEREGVQGEGRRLAAQPEGRARRTSRSSRARPDSPA